MPLLTELELFFIAHLQICRAYGAITITSDNLVNDTDRVRGCIFCKIPRPSHCNSHGGDSNGRSNQA